MQCLDGSSSTGPASDRVVDMVRNWTSQCNTLESQIIVYLIRYWSYLCPLKGRQAARQYNSWYAILLSVPPPLTTSRKIYHCKIDLKNETRTILFNDYNHKHIRRFVLATDTVALSHWHWPNFTAFTTALVMLFWSHWQCNGACFDSVTTKKGR